LRRFFGHAAGYDTAVDRGKHLSVVHAALWLVPGPISAGVASPFSGRITARLGLRRALLLWGVANALIQPTLFGGADAAPRDDLALAAAVLASARQLGSAVGVAVLVSILGTTAGGLSVHVGDCARLGAFTGLAGRLRASQARPRLSRPSAGASACVPEYGRHNVSATSDHYRHEASEIISKQYRERIQVARP
jgi:hypothetical protein